MPMSLGWVLGSMVPRDQGASWASVPGWKREERKVRTGTQRLLQSEKQKDEEKTVLHRKEEGNEMKTQERKS